MSGVTVRLVGPLRRHPKRALHGLLKRELSGDRGKRDRRELNDLFLRLSMGELQ